MAQGLEVTAQEEPLPNPYWGGPNLFFSVPADNTLPTALLVESEYFGGLGGVFLSEQEKE